MIQSDKLSLIFQRLEQFRGNGRDLVLFDSRDRGNYGAYDWERTAQMLRDADPTGLAEALMINEMIEATISGSKIELSRTLREEGFLDKLRAVLDIKKDLMVDLDAPLTAMLDRLTCALLSVSPEMGAPTSREATICLRDAIYCMSKGLKVRWIQCADVEMQPHVPLNPNITQHSDVAAFINALRHQLPFGAHLARIGTDNTAIGIKYPGRIAYLSSLSISAVSGTMQEGRANGYHMAENLDLDTPVERYPAWITFEYRNAGSYAVAHGKDTHSINHISVLPRDRLIWLAMVVEMAAQQMAATKAGTVPLCESLALALPNRASQSNLPVPFKPNWEADSLSLDAAFESLGLSDWEQRFLRPSLEGLSAEDFMPARSKPMAIRLDSRKVVEQIADDSGASYMERQELNTNSVPLTGMSGDWVGSREEVEQARRALLTRNLCAWLFEWGNRKFGQEWEALKPWIKKRLEKSLPKALAADCAYLRHQSHSGGYGSVHLYAQSTKHKTYNPRCFFDRKSEVTNIVSFYPKTSTDLVQMLGLKKESDLPEVLQGWARRLSWACTSSGNTKERPFGVTARWDFSRETSEHSSNPILEATVCLSFANLPPEIWTMLRERGPRKLSND